MPSSRPLLLRVAPVSESLALARTVASSVCAQLDFPIDQLDDVRLAVDEACSLLLAETDGSDVEVEFRPEADRLTITVSGGTRATSSPSPTSFAWLVISELCDEADAAVDAGRLTVRLRAQRRGVTVG